MILDNEEQRTILLELLTVVNIPGKVLETLYELKQAIKNAEVKSNTN
jgi:hypothetical protein